MCSGSACDFIAADVTINWDRKQNYGAHASQKRPVQTLKRPAMHIKRGLFIKGLCIAGPKGPFCVEETCYTLMV
jgi:hypothetical protein